MILGLPASTFFAFGIWPFFWVALAIYIYKKFKAADEAMEGGDHE